MTATQPRPTQTIVQRRATDVRLLGAGGYALALQVGHPTIAAGVREHSDYATNPWGRFFGTADFVALLLYGSPEQTTRASANLREMHKRIRGTDPDGTRYSALEPSAYAWVHATLAEGIIRGHHVFGREFTLKQKDEFWSEWLRLGSMMGIRDGDLPDTWRGFELYRDDMIDNVLVHSDVFDTLQGTASHATGGSPFGWMPAPVWSLAGRPLGQYMSFLARGTMGANLREKFRMPWTPRNQRTFARIAAAHRAANPVVRGPLRQAGPLALKLRKTEIAKGPFA